MMMMMIVFAPLHAKMYIYTSVPCSYRHSQTGCRGVEPTHTPNTKQICGPHILLYTHWHCAWKCTRIYRLRTTELENFSGKGFNSLPKPYPL